MPRNHTDSSTLLYIPWLNLSGWSHHLKQICKHSLLDAVTLELQFGWGHFFTLASYGKLWCHSIMSQKTFFSGKFFQRSLLLFLEGMQKIAKCRFRLISLGGPGLTFPKHLCQKFPVIRKVYESNVHQDRVVFKQKPHFHWEKWPWKMPILIKKWLSRHFMQLWKLSINSEFFMAVADTCAGVTGGGGSFSISFIQPLARGFETQKNASSSHFMAYSGGSPHFLSCWILKKIQ